MNEEEQLARELSEMTDEWQRDVESRYDEIMQYIVVLVALEELDSMDVGRVINSAFARAG